MKLSFREPTEEGVFVFDGELNKTEVDFLLQYAIVDLMAKGAFMKQLKLIEVPDEDPSIRH